jgi:NAD-dependent dihydropyrimidine dehydrogenase PreA subunit
MTLAAAPWAAAQAQNFFQQLFGYSAPAAQAPRQPNQPLTPGGRPYNFPSGPMSTPRRSSSSDDDDDRASKGSAYRTICVRMCDGYFFPISNSTTRKGFYRDQMKCSAGCGQEARLFHVPVNATGIDAATDQQGRVYSLLPIAFKYRKTLVPGCQCKADPWSEAELARHQKYADAEAAKAPAKAVVAEPAAGVAAPTETATAAIAAVVTPEAATAPTLSSPAKVAKFKPRAQPRPVAAPRPQAVQTAMAKPIKPISGAMGLGAGQFSWPGDKPNRP